MGVELLNTDRVLVIRSGMVHVIHRLDTGEYVTDVYRPSEALDLANSLTDAAFTADPELAAAAVDLLPDVAGAYDEATAAARRRRSH
jgi:hypothetical protein